MIFIDIGERMAILHRAVVPIGACYAGTLWLGNAAYLYLSVSFIQMLKVLMQTIFRQTTSVCVGHKHQLLNNQEHTLQALMPVAVFVVGCAFGTEKYSGGTLVNMLIVSLGVAIASYGRQIASYQCVIRHGLLSSCALQLPSE